MSEQVEYVYDLFVSFAEADRAWVEGYLLDALTRAGVHCLSEAAFALGAPRLLEFERAAQQSRRTLLVLSPAYFAERWTQFTDLLAQSYGLEMATWPVIPLILHPVQLPPRLAMLTALDATNPAQWTAALPRLCVALRRPAPGPSSRLPCPYPGMSPFSESESGRFFGRERETQEMVERLRLHPFLTIIGPSGSGKSSLVFAGLIPALRASGLFGSGEWLVRTLRPGEAPLTTLANALGSDPSNAAPAVARFVASQPDARRALLVVDQFEEVFTVARSETAAFESALLQMSLVPECFVVLTVRADFYPDLMTCPLWREIQAHRMEVLPLDDAGLRQAIVRPAESVRVFVEPALVERLVADAAGEPGVLPFVQEALVLLWECVERRFLPLRAYEALCGGETGRTGLQVAMARRADAVLLGLSPEQQRIARRILLWLVHFGEGRADTRRQQPVSLLRFSKDDPVVFEQTLGRLAEARLLVLSGEANADRKADLAHEALITGWPALQGWLSERREAEQVRRRLEAKAAEWVRLGRGSGGLLDEVELAEAEAWLSNPNAIELGYGETLPVFVRASQAAIERARANEAIARQREQAQTQSMAEAERRHVKTLSRRARLVWSLVGLFVLVVAIVLLYSSPVSTGWQTMSPPEQPVGSIEKSQWVVVASLTDPDLLYVSDQTAGGLHKSENGGLSWSRINTGRLADLSVRGIAASNQIVYVTTPEDVFLSNDGGIHWAAANFPPAKHSQPPWAVAVNPDRPSQAYVGTHDAGLWVTTDSGSTWLPIETFPASAGWIRAVASDGRNCVLATERGVWISRDAAHTWLPFNGQPALPPTVAGLTMSGQRGRFLIALGQAGIGDADVSSDLWFSLPGAPSSPFISSISASGLSLYAGSAQGLLCRRLWQWTEMNWWRARLGMQVPCYRR